MSFVVNTFTLFTGILAPMFMPVIIPPIICLNPDMDHMGFIITPHAREQLHYQMLHHLIILSIGLKWGELMPTSLAQQISLQELNYNA